MFLACCSSGRNVLRGPWFALLGSILIMAASGGTYVFGVYSSALRTSLGYNQKRLNTLSFFKNLGAGLGILPGVLYELAPTWEVLVLGAGVNLVGYLMMYLSVTKRVAPPPPVWLMRLYITVGAASQSFASTAAVVSAVKNFPDNRGDVLGLLTGYGGLSGAIFVELNRSFFHGSNDQGASLLLLLASLPTAMSLVFASTVRAIILSGSTTAGQLRRGFRAFLYTSIGLAISLLVMTIADSKVHCLATNCTYYLTAAATLLLVVLVVVLVVIFVKLELHTSMLLNLMVTNNKVAAATIQSACIQARGEGHSVVQALLSVDMLLIFLTAICGISGLLTAIDKLGQIGKSLGFDQGTISLLVSLANISSYAGRVVGGFGSEYMVARCRLPRPFGLTVALVAACAGHLIVAWGVGNGLYAASLLMGFCLGAQWPILFAIVSELFGLDHFSTLYNLVPLATPLGCYVLNVHVTGRLYDRQATLGTCIGLRCFRVSFSIIAGATVIGVAASLVLAWRTAKFYRVTIGDSTAASDGVGMVGNGSLKYKYF